MESFSIQCATCGRRLRVKDRRLIGQIVACPKCQAMVLIEPPPPLAMGDGDVDSEALTRDGISPVGSLESTASAEVPKDAWQAEEMAESPDGSVPSAAEHLAAEHLAAAKSVRDSKGALPPPLDGDEEVDGAVPPIAWQSESAAKTRQVVGIAAIGLISLLVAGTVFALVVRSWQDGKQRTAKNQTEAGGKEVEERNAEPNGGEVNLGSEVTDGSQSVEDGTLDGNETPDENETAVGSETTDGSDGGDMPGENDSPAGSEIPQDLGPAGDSADGGDVPTRGQPGSVDELFPEVAPPTAGNPAQVGGAVEGDAGTATELPDSLAQMVGVLKLGETARVVGADPKDAPPTMDDLLIRRPELAARQSEFPPPAARVDVRRSLEKVSVLRLEVSDRPLDKVLRELGQLGGVPFEFNLLAMDAAGLALDQSISLSTRTEDEKPLTNFLRPVVEQAGCRVTLNDGIIEVVPGNAAQRPLSLGQLQVDPDQLAADLRRMLGRIGDEVPLKVDAGSVEFGGESVQRDRAVLCVAGLALAQGVEVPVGGEGLQRWIARFDAGEAGLANAADWKPLPDKEVELRFDVAYSVEMILGDLASESSAALALDWTAAWTHGLTPSATALPWLRNRKLPQIVGEVLEPYGLVAYDTGGGVWWVGTPETYESMAILGILQSPHDEGVTRQMIAAASGLVETELPAMRDPVSGKWLVYLPRYVVRELPRVLSGRK